MASLLDDPNFMMTMGLGLLQSAQKGPRQNVGANLLSSLQQYAQGDAQRRSTAIAESENARRQAAQEQADRERQRASLLQQDFVTNAIGQKGGAFDAPLFPGEAPIPGLLNEPKGIVGGMLTPQEFYAKAAGVPGMEAEGMRGLGGLLEAQAKRDNPTFGNAPVWGFDANGNAVALQTSSAGGQLTPAIAPPGVQLAVPQTYKDFGGGIVALPSRAIPGAQPNVAKTLPPEKLPENIASAAEAGARGKTTGESAATAAIDLPNYLAKSEETIDLLSRLKDHPGMAMSVGSSSILKPWLIPGTPAADFKVMLDQVTGKQFLEAFESLKGGGQITEVEGNKATQAIARMSTSQSEPEFKKAADEFIEIIKKGQVRARQKAGVSQTPSTQQPSKVRRYNPATGRIE